MKGVKKGNPEREKEREIDMCRDRSPSGRRQNRPRYYQPATFPRTRDTPLLTAAQQRALDSIKQHLSFSDNEEVVSRFRITKALRLYTVAEFFVKRHTPGHES